MSYSISAIVIDYNDSDRVIDLVHKLYSYDFFESIAIVDNNSTDYHKNKLTSLGSMKDVNVIFLDENLGYQAGNNVGFKFCLEKYNSKYLCVINSDVIIDKDTLMQCYYSMESDSDLSLISPQMLDFEKKIDNSVSWDFKSYGYAIRFNFLLGRRINKKKEKKKFYYGSRKIIECDVVRGSFQLFRSKSLVEVNYYDEGLFLYFGEDSICKKIKNNGGKIALLIGNFYIHNHPKTKKIRTKRFRIALRDMNYYMSKYENISFIKKLFLKIFNIMGIMEHLFIDIISALGGE